LDIKDEDDDADEEDGTDENDAEISPIEQVAVGAIEAVGGAVSGALNGIADFLDDLVLKL
jgi:hypothetical protein